MQVDIKKFSVAMQVKTKGIELEVRSPDGQTHHGDLVVTKTGLTWCRGRTTPENGKPITWKAFIEYMESLGE
jgi:hypothetical protein